MTNTDFNTYIANLVGLWADRLNGKLLSAMAAQGLFHTGALQQSLKVKMITAVAGAAEVQVSFNSYGRVLDIKNRPHRMPTDTNAIRRLALGVDITRRDQNRQWYNRVWWKETQVLGDALFGNVAALADEDWSSV